MPVALVTGGTGFVGSNIALRLVEWRWQVRILERSGASHLLLEDGPFTYVRGDVLDPQSLIPAMRGIDVLFHAAAAVDFWRQGVDRMYEVNVEGTRNVKSAALAAGVERVVHTSSIAALGIHQPMVCGNGRVRGASRATGDRRGLQALRTYALLRMARE